MAWASWHYVTYCCIVPGLCGWCGLLWSTTQTCLPATELLLYQVWNLWLCGGTWCTVVESSLQGPDTQWEMRTGRVYESRDPDSSWPRSTADLVWRRKHVGTCNEVQRVWFSAGTSRKSNHYWPFFPARLSDSLSSTNVSQRSTTWYKDMRPKKTR